MATNFKPLPPPLQVPIVDEKGKVTTPWAVFFDYIYRLEKLYPSGGTTGQTLTKQSDDDYDADWA